jgi:hypothetical protein
MDPAAITGLVGACATLAKLTFMGLQSEYNAQQQYTKQRHFAFRQAQFHFVLPEPIGKIEFVHGQFQLQPHATSTSEDYGY